MRQLGDLLVWFVMVGVLIVVVYFTPKFAQYMSSENQPTLSAGSDRSLALHLIHSPEQAE
jgi:hypothetical protein